MLDAVESEELSLLAGLLRSNATNNTLSVAGATLAAAKISVAGATQAGGSLAVPVSGTEAEVVLPASLFAELGLDGAIVTVTAFDPSSALSMGSGSGSSQRRSGGAPVQVEAAVSVTLRSLSTGSKLSVDGLSEPIEVALPVNYTHGLECAYWDEQRLSWVTDGLSIGQGVLGKPLVCRSSHLTLFGAIVRGFAKSFGCSQATLFNAEAVGMLAKGEWHTSPGSVVFWAVLGALSATLLLAMFVDARRRRHWQWQDEHFLIPLGKEEDGPPEASSGAQTAEVAEEHRRGTATCLCCAVVVCCCSVISWMKQFSVVNDALAEIRELFQGFCGGLDIGGASGRGLGGHGFALVHRTMRSLIDSSARRQASASMRVSDEVLHFIMEDDRVRDILVARHERRRALGIEGDVAVPSKDLPRGGSSASAEMPHALTLPSELSRVVTDELSAEVGPAAWKRHEPRQMTMEREEALGRLHEAASHHIHEHLLKSSTCARLPAAVWRLLLVQNPFGAIFLNSIFASSSLRAFFFMLDIMGALMVGTVLFEASGSATGRASRARCSLEDPREQIGRLIAIGTGSILLSGLPVALLNSLHRRGFRKLAYKGCPEWRRQLRIWRIRDKVIWIVGSLYLALCAFFICLYLANVSEEDNGGWAISGVVSVLEGAVLVPFFIALFVPLLAALTLSVVSRAREVEKSELVRQRRAELMEGNLTLPVVSI